MRLLSLSLENIGPFDRAELRFLDEPSDAVPVAFITGENGTGKSIVVDAIRGLFGPSYAKLERDITRDGADPEPQRHRFHRSPRGLVSKAARRPG